MELKVYNTSMLFNEFVYNLNRNITVYGIGVRVIFCVVGNQIISCARKSKLHCLVFLRTINTGSTVVVLASLHRDAETIRAMNSWPMSESTIVGFLKKRAAVKQLNSLK